MHDDGMVREVVQAGPIHGDAWSGLLLRQGRLWRAKPGERHRPGSPNAAIKGHDTDGPPRLR